MGLSMSTFQKLLKEQFRGPAKTVFEETADTFQRALKKREDAKGGNILVPVRVKRNWGGGARSDGDTLPTAGNNEYQRFEIDPKLYYWRVQVSGPAQIRSQGGKARAYMEAVADEMSHALEQMHKRLNIHFWRGQEGYIGEASAAASGATLTLRGTGVAPGTNDVGVGHNDGVRFLHGGEGQTLDVIDSDGSTIHNAGLVVSSVNRSTNVITFTTNPSGSIAAGDFIAFASGKTTSDTWPGNAIEGVLTAIDNGDVRTSYHGLSRSTYPSLKASALESSTLRDLTEALLEDLLKTVYVNSGEYPTAATHEFTMSPSLHSAFVATQLPMKRYASKQLSAGYSDVDYNGIKFWMDPDHPFEMVFLLCWDDFKLYAVDGPDWVTDDGGGPLLRTSTTDEVEGRLRWFGETAWLRPSNCGVIRHLNDTPYTLRTT